MAQELKIPANFNKIRVKLASPEEILQWSYGEVIKPESINYRTQKPDKDGLFSERIFGPSKDYECYCGKYKRIRYKGVVCDKCGVEVTKASVRRERMGHIALAAPVAHIWFLRSAPSRIGTILNMSLSQLERVIYYSAYIITQIDEQAKEKLLADLDKEYLTKLKNKEKGKASEKNKLESAYNAARQELLSLSAKTVISEAEYHSLSLKYGPIFKAEIGAEPIKRLLSEINLPELKTELEEKLKQGTKDPQEKKKLLSRLKIVNAFILNGLRPEWMFLDMLPVMPADLRPMVQLDGGRFASSDLNDLYRRVINRNNRLKKLLELHAPEVIVRNEKRILQEAVDALLDNSARRTTGQQQVKSSTGGRRPLKSIADMLKGKQGRFRQNLLGKRVDYSARSVIVVGPELRLWECGIPKRMALELFKPFVIHELIKRDVANNIRSASRLIDEGIPEVWDALEEVIQGKLLFLNRAPTLHRLGIQGFRPILVEGLAISIPPMVCSAFNADFDGDQMAAHLPLSQEAQQEGHDLIISSKGILKPGTGDAIAVPSQDIILGCYWLSRIMPGAKGEGKIFPTADDAILAYELEVIDMQAKITVKTYKNETNCEISVGRILFNNTLPDDFEVVNKELNKRFLTGLVNKLLMRYGLERTPYLLDEIKNLGYRNATKSGISWGINDLQIPKEKEEIMREAEAEDQMVEQQFEEGLLTRDEKRVRSIEIWSLAKQRIEKVVPKTLDTDNSVFTIIDSGSRGSWTPIIQMMGMKGLVYNPAGETIELPIRSSYKEGFSVLEYFISTHGARKGTADTALRTATAGYLTRRMVDVAQDMIIREHDCGDTTGITISRLDTEEIGEKFGYRAFGRVSLEEIKDTAGNVIVQKGELIDHDKAEQVEQAPIEKLQIRSPLSCKTLYGTCSLCYGMDLGRGELAAIGQAVGVIAAQSIGEPGTQLTMRTFHTGGIAGGADITRGLPRVEEIFETRVPKGKAIISEIEGKVEAVKDMGDSYKVTLKNSETAVDYLVPRGMGVVVVAGQDLKQGDRISEGNIDIKEYFKLTDEESTKRYILNEIKKVYNFQGAPIHSKHIEIIVHKMFARVRIKDSGDSSILIGEIVPRDRVLEENKRLERENKKPIKASPLVMGISKVALSTDSFLSAASFQETARVLIKAALNGQVDYLRGLKENVIIGRLIPAGTSYTEMYKQPEKIDTETIAEE